MVPSGEKNKENNGNKIWIQLVDVIYTSGSYWNEGLTRFFRRVSVELNTAEPLFIFVEYGRLEIVKLTETVFKWCPTARRDEKRFYLWAHWNTILIKSYLLLLLIYQHTQPTYNLNISFLWHIPLTFLNVPNILCVYFPIITVSSLIHIITLSDSQDILSKGSFLHWTLEDYSEKKVSLGLFRYFYNS